MNLKEEYSSKLITAEKAAALVDDGCVVDYGWTTGMPVKFDAELAKRMVDLKDITVFGGIFCHVPEIFKMEDPGAHFTWNSWHMSGVERKAAEAGYGFYGAMRYSELPRFYRDRNVKVDIACFQTTEMDEDGNFNFGPNASHLAAICENADIVIVEVNKKMPRCLGEFENCVNIKDVTYIIEGDDPDIDQIPGGGASEIDVAIAKMVVEMIPNGACIQLGIGGMPNEVGRLIAESDLKDLGVHTEMFVDAFVDIHAQGKITGKYKNVNPGKMTYAFGAGTKKLYDFVDNNPECMSAPVNYVNDVRVISAIDNFISINNAIDIDLFGQVNAESSGIRQISGAGGQLDFVMGAYLSKGGKSFICMSSTFYDKKAGKMCSRIRPLLDPGSIITDTRANVQYVCTEFGCVNLKGLPSWQRAERLISIAHPDFREELIKSAEAMRIWRRNNKI